MLITYNTYKNPYYKRENSIMNEVCKNVFLSYNKNIVSQLKILREQDQRYRQAGKVDWPKQWALDSINQKMAMAIFDKYGYPNRSLVGVEFESVFFYVIQHSNLAMMEKFLPIIKHEIDVNHLPKEHYPFIHDRINLLKNLPQEYGTQFQVDPLGNEILINPIKDRKKLNENSAKYFLKALPD